MDKMTEDTAAHASAGPVGVFFRQKRRALHVRKLAAQLSALLLPLSTSLMGVLRPEARHLRGRTAPILKVRHITQKCGSWKRCTGKWYADAATSRLAVQHLAVSQSSLPSCGTLRVVAGCETTGVGREVILIALAVWRQLDRKMGSILLYILLLVATA